MLGWKCIFGISKSASSSKNHSDVNSFSHPRTSLGSQRKQRCHRKLQLLLISTEMEKMTMTATTRNILLGEKRGSFGQLTTQWHCRQSTTSAGRGKSRRFHEQSSQVALSHIFTHFSTSCSSSACLTLPGPGHRPTIPQRHSVAEAIDWATQRHRLGRALAIRYKSNEYT